MSPGYSFLSKPKYEVCPKAGIEPRIARHSRTAPGKRGLSLRRLRRSMAAVQMPVQVWVWAWMGCSLVAARRHAGTWTD